MPPDPADLVDTILAATRTAAPDEVYQRAARGYLNVTVERGVLLADEPTFRAWVDAVRGDPRPVAARQAAAVIRWLAAWDGDGCKCWRCIRDLADQLDTQETP